jgi:hypothetical protein
MRWRIAIPLIGLTLVALIPVVLGAIAWWDLRSSTDRIITIAAVVLLLGLAVSVSIGVRRTDDTPWLSIGAALLPTAHLRPRRPHASRVTPQPSSHAVASNRAGNCDQTESTRSVKASDRHSADMPTADVSHSA